VKLKNNTKITKITKIIKITEKKIEFFTYKKRYFFSKKKIEIKNVYLYNYNFYLIKQQQTCQFYPIYQ